MQGYRTVAATLKACGIDTIFGLMGDGNMRHIVSFIEEHSGRFVGAVTEGGAVSMARGYARASHRVGVASVTHGPGVTNTLTDLTEAARSGSPVVLLTGDTPDEKNHLQKIDLKAFADVAGALYRRVATAPELCADIASALGLAWKTQMPVLLDIPVALQEAFLSDEVSTPPGGVGPTGADGASIAPLDPDALDRALGIMHAARRPIVVAGRGAALAHAREEIIALADLLEAPLASTLQAKDWFHGHPFNLGIAGTLSSPPAVDTFARADCVIAFGASLNDMTTADGSLLEGKTVVRCDVSADNAERYTSADAVVVGDALAFARAARLQLADIDRPTSKTWRTDDLAQRLAAHATEPFHGNPTAGTVDMRTATVQLDDQLPKSRILVTDTGRFTRAPWRLFRVEDPLDFIPTGSFGSIGMGLATSIGAAVARPERLTVAFVGDGGGMMGITEFSTAVRNSIPLLVVVLNDGSYGAEYSKLEAFGHDPAHSIIRWPEFADMAVAMSGNGVAVTSAGDIARALELLAEAPEVPLLMDIKADPTIDLYVGGQ